MTNMMKILVEGIDKFMPGYKTYAVWAIALGMMVAQMLGYQEFPPEAWGVVGITGMGTWKMGQDRKGK